MFKKESNRFQVLEDYCASAELEIANRTIDGERVEFTLSSASRMSSEFDAVFCVAITPKLFHVYGRVDATTLAPNATLLGVYSK